MWHTIRNKIYLLNEKKRHFTATTTNEKSLIERPIQLVQAIRVWATVDDFTFEIHSDAPIQ